MCTSCASASAHPRAAASIASALARKPSSAEPSLGPSPSARQLASAWMHAIVPQALPSPSCCVR